MARILAVGIATLDVINLVDGYPAEDAEVRALGQRLRRGGNATNTLAVLARLGHRCAWAGMIADDPGAALVLADLERQGVELSATRRHPGGHTPTSYVTLNRRNGSRTIVHHRDLPEYGQAEFATLPLAGYDWLHFEGRNVAETGRMLAHARAQRPELPLSLEIEKPRPGIEALLGAAGLLLFSRHYAAARGYGEAGPFLAAMAAAAPEAVLVCAWGEAGAYGRAPGGPLRHAPACPPPRLVDTLGAGDTFNAGIIDALLRGLELEEALAAANRLAGHKCGMEGLDGLRCTF